MLNCIFLSDLVIVDGRYLESFVFDPGPVKQQSNSCFPWECPTQSDWYTWFNFWYNYATMGNKLRVPLRRWRHPAHRKWLWYTTSPNDLQRIEDGFMYHYLPTQSTRHTRLGLAYTFKWKVQLQNTHVLGLPVSVQGSDEQQVYKLMVGPSLTRGPQQPSNFWDFLMSWGGKWMWEGTEDSQTTKHDLSWLIKGMNTKMFKCFLIKLSEYILKFLIQCKKGQTNFCLSFPSCRQSNCTRVI